MGPDLEPPADIQPDHRAARSRQGRKERSPVARHSPGPLPANQGNSNRRDSRKLPGFRTISAIGRRSQRVLCLPRRSSLAETRSEPI